MALLQGNLNLIHAAQNLKGGQRKEPSRNSLIAYARIKKNYQLIKSINNSFNELSCLYLSYTKNYFFISENEFNILFKILLLKIEMHLSFKDNTEILIQKKTDSYKMNELFSFIAINSIPSYKTKDKTYSTKERFDMYFEEKIKYIEKQINTIKDEEVLMHLNIIKKRIEYVKKELSFFYNNTKSE